MDLKGYFKRIGFSGLYDKADLDTLRTIHKLHVMTIPFENLSLHSGGKNTMDLKVIYEKIVCEHRGGWCCENNLLFSWVLKEMGYTFTTLGGKVFSRVKNDYSTMDCHLINMVEIEGKSYITDVSFGTSSQIWWPLEIIADKDQPQPPGVFRLLNDGDRWMLEITERKPLIQNESLANSRLAEKFGTHPMYSFSLTPRAVDHFLETSEYLQTSPESLFLLKSICSLQTPTGYRALIGWTYSEVTFNPEEDRDVYELRNIPDSEIEAILKDKFSVTLGKKVTAINKKDTAFGVLNLLV
ncbi:arylamine N-acetyltransferase, pineal gland isozyme NAT-10 [Astyanax mexicanus]|uniref:arylamine N-acetyltransferase, pineal gland isozyme NAT-10 n=1 Tax=Astyanax mexicanus TaxID=7994 RepID=UPI0020CAD41E|nr:arylamine N-acetyltransferase, pineal gland isozyme NAT-10 [Astyanax mexicanus]